MLKGFTETRGRQSNKMSLEQLVKYKSDNFDSGAFNITLDVAKTRGSATGLPLGRFVRKQLKHD